MKITSKEQLYFKKLEFNIFQKRKEYKLDFKDRFRLRKDGLLKKPFNFKLKIDNTVIENKNGRFGNEALWFPIDSTSGLKIIRDTGNLVQIFNNLHYIKENDISIFPKIHWFEYGITNTGIACIIINIENVSIISEPIKIDESFILKTDYEYLLQNLPNSLADLKKCNDEIIKFELCPEDEWYKKTPFTINMVNGKILDFHNFYHSYKKYNFPSNGVSYKETEQIYNAALESYKKWIPKDGLPKWKGKIYQGMKFDNGFIMPGYSSDECFFDSYVKTNFMPFSRMKGMNVLDLGSNQGFFSFQAAIHGAAKIIGVEITKEDVDFAKQINNKLLKFNNVTFVQDDVVSYIKKNKEKFEFIFLNSVLHQIFPHMEKSEQFLNNIAKNCEYFIFETPVHHKVMNLNLQQIHDKLNDIFKRVRIVYLYDAYSSGSRAIFLCHSKEQREDKR